MNKVSVIVPVYNVEKYLPRCLDYIVGQTLKDIEIICVDDGSTDGSGAILDEYAAKDARVRVVHRPNAGAGAARNVGLDLATGEYLFFCDPDDWCERDMLGKLYARACDLDADIVVCGRSVYDDSRHRVLTEYSFPADFRSLRQPFSGLEVAGHDFFLAARTVVWNKLFRRSFVNGEAIRFQEIADSNDLYFVDVALAVARRIGTVNEALYHYRMNRSGSIQDRRRGSSCWKDAYAAVKDELLRRGVFEAFRANFERMCAAAEGYNARWENPYPDGLAFRLKNCVPFRLKEMLKGASYRLGAVVRFVRHGREVLRAEGFRAAFGDFLLRCGGAVLPPATNLGIKAGYREMRDLLYSLACERAMETNGGDGRIFSALTAGAGIVGVFPDKIRKLCPNLDFSGRMAGGARYGFLWGRLPLLANMAVLGEVVRHGGTLVLCEDGFLRSAVTPAVKGVPQRFVEGCSVVFDSEGCYFDATRPTDIERMLNDRSLEVTDEQRRRARRLIDRIVAEKLTKYNHQPLVCPDLGRPGRSKVLVVDQSYGDYAIRKGWADDSTFSRMLEDAIRDNPDCDILVKTHPDTMAGWKSGYYSDVREGGNVFRLTAPVNPIVLLQNVSKVYVCSTQMGFEALLCGKETHVYGMPFYAGWGLTVDSQRNPRRTNRRTLEEMFYIFYVLYTRWYNPDTGCGCEIEEAIDWLLKVRGDYDSWCVTGQGIPEENA